MNIYLGNQSQFELFPRTTGEPIENSAPRFIFSRVVLSFDNVVVVFVFVILALIIAFSIGVDRGRVKARMARPIAGVAIAGPLLTSVMPRTQMTTVTTLPANTKPIVVNTGVAEAAAREVVPVATIAAPVTTRTVPLQKGVDKGYTVQVASYKKESMAQKEVVDLKAKGLESFVAIKGDYAIVCVGRFSSQDQAKQMQGKLKKRYKDSMIRSY